MSIVPIAPIGPTAAALRVQVISPVETELLAALESAQATQELTQGVKPVAHAPPANPVRQAVEVARADAAGRQASLATLFADLIPALESPTLPAAVKAAATQLLGLRTPLAGPLTAETLRQAVAQSGLFLEARLRDPQRAGEPDLKAALLTLQRALAAVPAAPPANSPKAVAAPPPARDAALSGQPPAYPTLSAADEAPVIVGRLLREADQGLARQVLHQLASLPGGPQTWMFELPLATPQGTALAHFEIDREGAGSASGGPADGWRVRFSIDVEPLGPVHVHLGLNGERAAVTVWAEREDGLERLRSQGAALASALPGDVVFHPGAPRRPLPDRGAFVDRAL